MKKLTLIISFLSVFTAFGQNSEILEKSKKLNTKHQYQASIKLLEDYLQTRKDVYTLWQYGQTLHAVNKYGKALEAYKEALQFDPNNSVLKYDYALKSADAGKLNQAIKLIKPYAEYQSDYQFDALKNLAQFYYWQGAYDQSNATLQKAKWFKNDDDTKQLQIKINQAKSNYITADFSLFSDDQPLTIINPNVGIGYYVNQVITVGMDVKSPIYSLPEEQLTSLSLKPFVTFNLSAIAAKTTLSLNYDKLPDSETVIGGGLAISKYVIKNLNVEAKYEYVPYLYTLTSLNQKLMQSHYNVGLIWDNPKGITGKLAFDLFDFSSLNNSYYAASAWALSPRYNIDIVELRAGLGVNYSDTNQNTFISKKDTQTIVSNYFGEQKIEGHYEPFFSPSKQLVTSLIITAKSQLNKALTLSVDGNLGIFANTQNPYLFLDRNAHYQYFINRDFSKVSYFPFSAKLSADYLLSNQIALKVHYIFQSTNYYQSHLGGITALYKF